jgi:hypothetical protein
MRKSPQTVSRARWAKTVTQCLSRPEFRQAWNEVGECGPGSDASVKVCWKLLDESVWHRARLIGSMYDVVDAMTKWVDAPDEEHYKALAIEIYSILKTNAALYVIVGAMVGVGSIAGVGADAGDAGDAGP